MMIRPLTPLLKLARVLAALIHGMWKYVTMAKPRPGDGIADKSAQIAWGSGVARALAQAFDLRVTVEGAVPTKGCLVSNHLGLLDIFVLLGIVPAVFVGKSDIARWPVFGWLATRGGTLFIERRRKGDTVRVIGAMRRYLDAGLPVAFFPEGTSSRGDTVLPFHSPLVEAICDGQSPVSAAAVGYSRPHVASYAGDDRLIPHLCKLLCSGPMEVRVRFSAPMLLNSDRKHAARILHNEVTRLHAGLATGAICQPKSPGILQEPLPING
ncbi:lysophospholipid acyltransferase family protein [Kamptonema cortianum]|nr:lysophospholipid acyltransferase family protein [Oscillatoria laete-virens]MDK3157182.1 lysophospholipid acyltransferase family protein [Kamptonema cortianum]MDL5054434.1 lysophospholipid acyltransferase family protein [Oscillatoria laete-virens NRMC-F 0139]